MWSRWHLQVLGLFRFSAVLPRLFDTKALTVTVSLSIGMSNCVLVLVVSDVVKCWTRVYFHDVLMKSLGLTVHLGHGSQHCDIPGELIKDFTVVDTTRIHYINL